jgi:hypothetical protein
MGVKENDDPLPEKHKVFNLAIAELEFLHAEYFKKRKSPVAERQDKITDHLLTYHEGTLHYINWNKDTEPDQRIRKEVEYVFDAIYGGD